MACRTILGPYRRQSQPKAPQCKVIASSQHVTALNIPSQTCQLTPPQCSVDIGHAVIESEHLLLVVPGRRVAVLKARWIARYPMSAQHHHPFGQYRIVGERGATFATGYDLYRMKTQDRDVRPSTASDRLAISRRTNRVRGILQDPKAIFLCQLPNSLLLGGLPCKM